MNTFVKTRSEVVTYIKQKVMICENGYIEIRDYKNCIEKIKDGYEATTKENNASGRIASDLVSQEKNIRDDSLYRSRKTLINYVNENEKEWNTFITLTFEDNIKDISYANHKFNIFVTSIKRIYKDFKYIGVPEFQKRGAVHYHLLTNIEIESNLCPIQENKKNMYNVKFWNYGFSSVFNLKDTDKDFNVLAYIMKYLYKDLDKRLYGRTKVLKSNNLKKPLIIELEENSDLYNYAKYFIDDKDIQYEEKEIIPNQQYAIPFSLTLCKTSNKNIKKLKAVYARKDK